ncbi:sucrase ferredoxin [Naumannella halotolerans]|uniref:sucrase ferredoxin n=1 Tax=Naumannella halotolerans TaxID=993414 RepID=UPI00370D101D
MTEGPERFLCATAARERGDEMAGTAAVARCWVLIEYRGAWPFAGFGELAAVAPELRASIIAATRAAGGRTFLIRRAGRRSSDLPPRWAVVQRHLDGSTSQHWGTWEQDTDLAPIPGLIGRRGRTDLPPLLLVCTHGVHDVCCALRGRPVGAALARRWPQGTWECSHVGGDRFAANLVVLPDGVYYGGLDPDTAVTTVENHLADSISATHLRGYTDLGPPQQAAVAEVLRRFGPAGREQLQVIGTVRGQGSWSIRLQGAGPLPAEIVVEVRAERSPRAQMTCRAPGPASVLRYRVERLVVERGRPEVVDRSPPTTEPGR